MPLILNVYIQALDLNGQLLLNRPVKLDIARERAKTPNTRFVAKNEVFSYGLMFFLQFFFFFGIIEGDCFLVCL